jgi:RNA polymerase sigma-70 factor (ECF subfamily)
MTVDLLVGPTVERVARDAYGRLVALLAARHHDLASAEDALSDALLEALQTWPLVGIPEKPEAWLLTVARRQLIDLGRRRERLKQANDHLIRMSDEIGEAMQAPLLDHRLSLMFACAHPDIDEGARTPLMLQVVLGLSAQRIASAFLTSPESMTKRLTRAKIQIKQLGLRFEHPEPGDVPSRLEAVLCAVYAAYSIGWDGAGDAYDGRTNGLADEAIWLAGILEGLLPRDAEVLGLLSLMLYSHARLGARRHGQTGGFIPLSEQDCALWDRACLNRAEGLLRRAGALKSMGRFQLEAAIQAVHSDRRKTGVVDWSALVVLYDGLVDMAPTLGARLGRVGAIGAAHGGEAGLVALSQITAPNLMQVQSYWALRADFERAAGRTEEAFASYNRAAGLSEDAAVRQWLLAQARRLVN